MLSVWLAGALSPGSGFIVLFVLSALFSFGHASLFVAAPLAFVGALVAGVLPFTLYRLSGLTRFSHTLLLPLWVVAAYGLAGTWLPENVAAVFFNARSLPSLHIGGTELVLTAVGLLALTHWVAAVVLYVWQRHAHPLGILGAGVGAAAGGAVFLAGVEAFHLLDFGVLFHTGPSYAWLAALSGALLQSRDVVEYKGAQPWAGRDVSLLQCPSSGAALTVQEQNGQEALVSAGGARYAIVDGIPQFASQCAGLNKKYRRLYQLIGGFYEDFQRVFFALNGISQKKYFSQYLGLLEIRPGDRVLETSVGTGLNIYYLPRGAQYFGLDLSPVMLENACRFLARMKADITLLQGNAEALPFAEASMDVVFHCGGINFFSDRKSAVTEMIRVAKPGSRILIADETEKLVRNVYEKVPLSGLFFRQKDRKAVSVPRDLIPPDMEEVEVHLFRNAEFYALTFRKPV